jgi:alkylated DNA repair dioxygenase AlkB
MYENLMLTLFDITPDLPEGFSYYPNFITSDEEKKLLQFVDELELKNMQFHEYEARRKVVSFGKGWSFTEQRLKEGNAIPQALYFLLERIANHIGISPESFAQVVITEYPIGSVINWHRDAPPFKTIAGISLLSDCVFKIRPHDKAKQKRESTVSLDVERRSLYIISGTAKTEWEHSIAPVKQMRYSITFRTLL